MGSQQLGSDVLIQKRGDTNSHHAVFQGKALGNKDSSFGMTGGQKHFYSKNNTQGMMSPIAIIDSNGSQQHPNMTITHSKGNNDSLVRRTGSSKNSKRASQNNSVVGNKPHQEGSNIIMQDIPHNKHRIIFKQNHNRTKSEAEGLMAPIQLNKTVNPNYQKAPQTKQIAIALDQESKRQSVNSSLGDMYNPSAPFVLQSELPGKGVIHHKKQKTMVNPITHEFGPGQLDAKKKKDFIKKLAVNSASRQLGSTDLVRTLNSSVTNKGTKKASILLQKSVGSGGGSTQYNSQLLSGNPEDREFLSSLDNNKFSSGVGQITSSINMIPPGEDSITTNPTKLNDKYASMMCKDKHKRSSSDAPPHPQSFQSRANATPNMDIHNASVNSYDSQGNPKESRGKGHHKRNSHIIMMGNSGSNEHSAQKNFFYYPQGLANSSVKTIHKKVIKKKHPSGLEGSGVRGYSSTSGSSPYKGIKPLAQSIQGNYSSTNQNIIAQINIKQSSSQGDSHSSFMQSQLSGTQKFQNSQAYGAVPPPAFGQVEGLSNSFDMQAKHFNSVLNRQHNDKTHKVNISQDFKTNSAGSNYKLNYFPGQNNKKQTQLSNESMFNSTLKQFIPGAESKTPELPLSHHRQSSMQQPGRLQQNSSNQTPSGLSSSIKKILNNNNNKGVKQSVQGGDQSLIMPSFPQLQSPINGRKKSNQSNLSTNEKIIYKTHHKSTKSQIPQQPKPSSGEQPHETYHRKGIASSTQFILDSRQKKKSMGGQPGPGIPPQMIMNTSIGAKLKKEKQDPSNDGMIFYVSKQQQNEQSKSSKQENRRHQKIASIIEQSKQQPATAPPERELNRDSIDEQMYQDPQIINLSGMRQGEGMMIQRPIDNQNMKQFYMQKQVSKKSEGIQFPSHETNENALSKQGSKGTNKSLASDVLFPKKHSSKGSLSSQTKNQKRIRSPKTRDQINKDIHDALSPKMMSPQGSKPQSRQSKGGRKKAQPQGDDFFISPFRDFDGQGQQIPPLIPIEDNQDEVDTSNNQFADMIRKSQNLKMINMSELMRNVDEQSEDEYDEDEFVEPESLSPRTKEIYEIKLKIRDAFRESGDPPETTLEFYKIGKIIGKGAFGKVNLALHKLARQLVAIKSINKKYLSEESSKRKVMQEVTILRKIRHRHVVKLYETFETSKHILFVMDLCSGGDLLNYVRKRRRLKENIAKFLFKQIIEGIGYIHSKNILHRDIKLDNILFDESGNIKICDFGVSKLVTPNEPMFEKCGTPAYIAPEILLSKADTGYMGFKADLWSAGVVLFAMLYGAVPFKGANMQELHDHITNSRFTLKDDIGQEAQDLIKKLLEVDPDKRIGIKEIFVHPWMRGIEKNLKIFNENEEKIIKKEFTYNDTKRLNRNQPVESQQNSVGGGRIETDNTHYFTEQNMESTQNVLQKNISEKSFILAPFNTTKSNITDTLPGDIKKHLRGNNQGILKFGAQVKEIDRQYELNNNQDLDNGVFNQEDAEGGAEFEGGNGDEKRKVYDEEDRPNHLRRDSKKSSFSRLSNATKDLTINTNSKVKKNNTGELSLIERRSQQSNFDQLLQGEPFSLNESIVKLVEKFRYPKRYIEHSLNNYESNYCTATYFLLQAMH